MPKYVNAPGRFSRKPRQVARDAKRLTGMAGVVVDAVTEVANADRAAALEVDGFTLHHHGGAGMGECAILTKDSHYQTIHASTVLRLTDGGKKSRLRGRVGKPLYARAVVAETKAGHVQMLTNAHLPAHLEGLWALVPMSRRLRVKRLMRSGNPRVRLWLEAVTEWRKQVMDLAAEHHADDVLVMADWNLNGHRKWVRDLMAKVWPGLEMVVPKKADLGPRRSVGWVLTTMRPVRISTVGQQVSSDHKANVFDLVHVNEHPVKKKPEKAPPPFERCTYNGALMDNKTKTFIQTMERELGYSLTILQGCYHPGVSQSAGTHDGGGVVDLAPFDWERKVHVARKHGGFYWHRLPIPGVWGEHIHGGIRNHGTLSPSAKAQQRDYDGHPPLDGLADHAVDNTWHPSPPVGFNYTAAWRALQKPPAKKPAKKAPARP